MGKATLCGKCVELMRDRFIVRLVHRPINNKVDCQCCKRRRYGGEYELTPKK